MHNSAYTPFYGVMLHDIVISQHDTKIGDKVVYIGFRSDRSNDSTRLHSTTAFRQHWPKFYQIYSVFLRLV